MDMKKFCQACAKELRRKRFGDRLEDRTALLKRKFCSLSCAGSKKKVRPNTLMWRARRLRKPNCEACGTTKKLEVHHVNGNRKNNDESNLQTLCNVCHKFLHTIQRWLGMPILKRPPRLFP